MVANEDNNSDYRRSDASEIILDSQNRSALHQSEMENGNDQQEKDEHKKLRINDQLKQLADSSEDIKNPDVILREIILSFSENQRW